MGADTDTVSGTYGSVLSGLEYLNLYLSFESVYETIAFRLQIRTVNRAIPIHIIVRILIAKTVLIS